MYAQPRIRPAKWDSQTSLRFWDINGSLNLGQTTRPSDSQQKKRRKKKEKKEKLPNCGLCCSVWLQSKTEIKLRDMYLDLAREQKTMEHESDSGTNQYCHQRIGTGSGGLWNKRMSGDHPNDSIIKISQNTEKSPGDLRRLAVTQTLLRNYQLTLGWKPSKEWNNDDDNNNNQTKIRWPN